MLSTRCILILVSISLATAQQDSCILNIIDNNLVVVDKNLHIPLPINNSNYITFGFDETFSIKCPQGTTNSLLNEQGEQVLCKGDTQILIQRSEATADFSRIRCSENDIPSTVRINGQSCQDEEGIQVQIGFDILEDFATAYTVCFDDKNLVPLYAMFNASFSHRGSYSNETKEHAFIDNADLYNGVEINQLYFNQQEIFEQLGIAEYITDDVYLVQGQVLPSYLFSYPMEGYAAFDYANVVPQWSTIRNQLAAFADVFITGYMLQPPLYLAGTSGVATLTNAAGEQVELYLSNGKVPVPRWLWFTFEGVFTAYGYNNPYYDAADVEAEFKEMCEEPYTFIPFNNMLVGICGENQNFSKLISNKV